MISDQMRIIDIIEKSEPWAMDLLREEQTNIEEEDVKLKKNYINLDLNSFFSFTLLVTDDHRLVAFAGLQKAGPWDQKVGRICSRFRIAKPFQTFNMLNRTYDRSIFSGSKYIMPYQIGVAIKLGLTGVFFSRENPKRRAYLQSIADRCNEFENRVRYEVHPKVVNVCRRYGDGIVNQETTCWQNAVIARISADFELGLPEKDPRSFL